MSCPPTDPVVWSPAQVRWREGGPDQLRDVPKAMSDAGEEAERSLSDLEP